MDEFFSTAILTGLRSSARRVGRQGEGKWGLLAPNYWCDVCVKLMVHHYTSSML